MQKRKPSVKMNQRPEFSIKKRPKSLSSSKKLDGTLSNRYLPEKKSTDGYTTIGSVSRPIMKLNNLYVPW